MHVIDEIVVENDYSGSDWNYERTTKYIIEVNGIEIEAGYFEHYRDECLIKTVLELPQSYGCPAKCRFCASAAIDRYLPLDSGFLEELFLFLYNKNKLSRQNYVLLTMTGIGDLFFNFNNVREFLLKIKSYANVYVTLSSCLWNMNMLRNVEELSSKIRIRNIQITYVTEEKADMENIIPYYKKNGYGFNLVRQYIMDSGFSCYRINYIMIRGVNDSVDDFQRFIKNFECIKDKIVVRISKLNETGATRRNHLQATEIKVLEEFQGILQKSGIRSYVFYACKNDNMNCGQLITERQ